MNPKSTLLATIALGLTATVAGAATPIDRTQATTASPSVEVVNVQGLVRVRAWDRNEVRLTGVLENDRDELEFSGDAGQVTIRVRPEKDNGRVRDDARLELSVPKGASLNVQAVSADIEVEGVHGTQRLESVSGDVTTVVYGEELWLRTISGDASVTGQGGTSTTFVESVSGNVTARGLKGEVSSQSVSGDVDLEVEAATRVRLKTVSGEIGAKLGFGGSAQLDAESVSGNIVLAFPTTVDAEFDIETFSGDIDNCFGPKPERKSRYAPGQQLRFTEGKGSARVRIDTMSGDIELCNR